MEDKNATAENAVENIKTAALEIANGDLNPISAISSDTCPTMQAVWRKFAEIPELAHIFSISRDSHGN